NRQSRRGATFLAPARIVVLHVGGCAGVNRSRMVYVSPENHPVTWDIPLLTEEGWTRHQENVAKPPLVERTGWSLTGNVSECAFELCLVSDHPVCSASVASQHLLLAQPPLLSE